MCSAITFLYSDLPLTPVMTSTRAFSLKMCTVGVPVTPAASAISGSASMSISTKCTPFESISSMSATALRSIGFSARHGPHVGDVYSTLTMDRGDSWYNLRSANCPLWYVCVMSNVSLLSSTSSCVSSAAALLALATFCASCCAGVGTDFTSTRRSFSARYRSVAIAAMHPLPAAVMAWRHSVSCRSPAQNTPGVDVRHPSVTLTYPASSRSTWPLSTVLLGVWPMP
mmetsp:Transcript_13197/g.30173  ORF Transcript_13197/g.30173 Transcript_13197/m.30173 type:complete len:227 (+) Transcript_13197:220-900(+)